MKLLITGGTGTFGNAFTKRVLTDNLYGRIVILSRDEKKQQDMRRRFDDSRLRFLLGDVRDADRLHRAFNGVDIVIHAAALKQVDRSGGDFDEFYKTNCGGSFNVINAAIHAGVRQILGLSSDKACRPTTPYGGTKLILEYAFTRANEWGHSRFACVRYGNVIGSRGSVLDIWRDRVAANLPLQITNPDMTRFWMTVEQSVDLVLLALEHMQGGEVFVPKDLDRSSIADLAEKHHPGWPVEIIGLNSYEKIHEELIAPDEIAQVREDEDCYVVRPLHVRWEPEPYGGDLPGIELETKNRLDAGRVQFSYRSDTDQRFGATRRPVATRTL